MSAGRWIGAAFVALAAAGLGLFFFLPSKSPALSANGVYENDCCGEVSLKDGRMVLNDKKFVTYVVGRDEAGPYILPKTYVGTWEDRGFEIDGSRPPIKLRLDRLPKPARIEIPAARGSYRFERKTWRNPLLERQGRASGRDKI